MEPPKKPFQYQDLEKVALKVKKLAITFQNLLFQIKR